VRPRAKSALGAGLVLCLLYSPGPVAGESVDPIRDEAVLEAVLRKVHEILEGDPSRVRGDQVESYCLILRGTTVRDEFFRHVDDLKPPVRPGKDCSALHRARLGITLARVRWIGDTEARVEAWAGDGHGLWVVQWRYGKWVVPGAEGGWVG
jgi:hypothetical protein